VIYVFETTHFGIEVEFTGVTRWDAAQAIAQVLRGEAQGAGGCQVFAPDRRIWKLVYDSSIAAQRKNANNRKVSAGEDYKCELVSPILSYQNDIDAVQSVIRKLRKLGAFTNDSCGIHIHLDGAPHTPQSVRNFVNIIASKNDLLYKALQIKAERMRFCKKIDAYLVERMNREKPTTFEQISNIWYSGYNEDRDQHYHHSRYQFLNLHSFFTGNHTIELRGFNSELHAGKVRTYIVLALALNRQALAQRNASYKKVQEENERFAMRTYCNRLGLIGDEFKSCREHLCASLSGDGAWRFGSVNGRSIRTIQNEEASDNA
jgi:hypothetical protein